MPNPSARYYTQWNDYLYNQMPSEDAEAMKRHLDIEDTRLRKEELHFLKDEGLCVLHKIQNRTIIIMWFIEKLYLT
jgi:hypothetical protein